MTAMIEALERELEILKSSRRNEVERALGLLDPVVAGSEHLGHKLGNVAIEISQIDGKLKQTERILRSLVAESEGRK